MSGHDELGAVLGGRPVELSGVTDEDAGRLADLIEDACARQARSLDHAIAGGLSRIPRLLRGPVKAVLFR